MKGETKTQAETEQKPRSAQELEEGGASIFVDLTEGKITVKHGTDGDILLRRDCPKGTWIKMWAVLRGEEK